MISEVSIGIYFFIKTNMRMFSPLADMAIVLNAPNTMLWFSYHDGRLFKHSEVTISAWEIIFVFVAVAVVVVEIVVDVDTYKGWFSPTGKKS